METKGMKKMRQSWRISRDSISASITWTTQSPTEGGVYWVCNPGEDSPQMVRYDTYISESVDAGCFFFLEDAAIYKGKDEDTEKRRFTRQELSDAFTHWAKIEKPSRVGFFPDMINNSGIYIFEGYKDVDIGACRVFCDNKLKKDPVVWELDSTHATTLSRYVRMRKLYGHILTFYGPIEIPRPPSIKQK